MNVFRINGGNKRAKIISQVQANTFQRLWVTQNKQMFFVLCEFPRSELGMTVLTVQFHAVGQGADQGQRSERQGRAPTSPWQTFPTDPLGRLESLGLYKHNSVFSHYWPLQGHSRAATPSSAIMPNSRLTLTPDCLQMNQQQRTSPPGLGLLNPTPALLNHCPKESQPSGFCTGYQQRGTWPRAGAWASKSKDLGFRSHLSPVPSPGEPAIA